MIDGAWDWRDEEAASCLRRAEGVVLAQEFLRSNPVYRTGHVALLHTHFPTAAAREAALASFG
ncbi:transcriptional regulator domain-containing protein, partial [Acidomonas methanolica]